MPWSGWPRRHPDIPAGPAGDRDGAETPTPPQGTQSYMVAMNDWRRKVLILGMGFLWASVMTLGTPVLWVLLCYRALMRKEIAARLHERRGIEMMPRPPDRLLWLHAASVGEALSILPIIALLGKSAPTLAMLLTTGTVTSARLVEHRLSEMGLSASVIHRFAPLDVPSWVSRFLDHWRPDAVGFLESELWPNILSACRYRSIPTTLINGRMSARTYAFWSQASWVACSILNNFARIYARCEEDAVRFRSLGAVEVEVLGDLKLCADPLQVDPKVLRDMTELLGNRPIFLAASTHPGEEALIQAVHNSLRANHPGLLTIIVPRHPERGLELSRVLNAPSRQGGQAPPAEGIWIADTLGELGLWYSLCHVSFVGRSLIAPGGGQNPLEPARLGCSIVTGPFTQNFVEHITLLKAAQALEVASDEVALTQFVNHMLTDQDARILMGRRAKATVTSSDTLAQSISQSVRELMV